jgi:PleD family two-component response regulator
VRGVCGTVLALTVAREEHLMSNEIAPVIGAGSSVLLVMEDLFFRKLLRRELEEAGYEVAEAISVDRALARLGVSPPDLVLLDTWVDRGAGLQLLEAVRASDHWQHIPVLLVGGDRRGEVHSRGQQLGALGPVPISRSAGVGLWVDAALGGVERSN